MKQLREQCPECGGGPVLPITWRRRGRAGIDRVETRCRNCGTVTKVPKEELRW
jgi:uncharacterized Zn finger protein